MSGEGRTFARVETLFDVDALANVEVLIAGCGSGGSAVAQHLAMTGVPRFTLVDDDVLEVENIDRHACGRRYVGWRKVDALAEVILDRNPAAQIHRVDADLMDLPELPDLVAQASVVILATDNEPSRRLINAVCVETLTPFVVGRVFHKGIGGEVFSFRPGEGGCLACLEAYLERTDLREGTRKIDALVAEGKDIYGLSPEELKDSPGLGIDIAAVTTFHAAFALDTVFGQLPQRPTFAPAIAENYLTWGNRPVAPFTAHFQLGRFVLQPRIGCAVCNLGT